MSITTQTTKQKTRRFEQVYCSWSLVLQCILRKYTEQNTVKRAEEIESEG